MLSFSLNGSLDVVVIILWILISWTFSNKYFAQNIYKALKIFIIQKFILKLSALSNEVSLFDVAYYRFLEFREMTNLNRHQFTWAYNKH